MSEKNRSFNQPMGMIMKKSLIHLFCISRAQSFNPDLATTACIAPTTLYHTLWNVNLFDETNQLSKSSLAKCKMRPPPFVTPRQPSSPPTCQHGLLLSLSLQNARVVDVRGCAPACACTCVCVRACVCPPVSTHVNDRQWTSLVTPNVKCAPLLSPPVRMHWTVSVWSSRLATTGCFTQTVFWNNDGS